MTKQVVADHLVLISVEPSDVESAIRQFICTCFPEYAQGWTLNPQIPISIGRTIFFDCERPAKKIVTKEVGILHLDSLPDRDQSRIYVRAMPSDAKNIRVFYDTKE